MYFDNYKPKFSELIKNKQANMNDNRKSKGLIETTSIISKLVTPNLNTITSESVEKSKRLSFN
jgi:hypothetical protein